jgi:hypothetical protein
MLLGSPWRLDPEEVATMFMRSRDTEGGGGLRRAAALGAGILLLAGAAAYGQQAPRWEADGSCVVVKLGDKPLVKYQYVENPAKPYVAELYSPEGVNVLRDSPIDHKHHHGLMFAVAVDGVDFWAEGDKFGLERHREGEEPRVIQRDGRSWVVGTQKIDWGAPPGDKLLLRESRTMVVGRAADGRATALGWQSLLETPPGKDSVTLTGSPYFGLGMRFVQSMDKGGTFLNADGKTGVKGTNDARSAWCAYSAAAGGKPVTVAMFDLPGNPRHPATWFTMDQGFAYMAATLNLSKEPLTIQSGKPLVLRYAVAVWDGKVEKATIDALYQRLVKLAERKPE